MPNWTFGSRVVQPPATLPSPIQPTPNLTTEPDTMAKAAPVTPLFSFGHRKINPLMTDMPHPDPSPNSTIRSQHLDASAATTPPISPFSFGCRKIQPPTQAPTATSPSSSSSSHPIARPIHRLSEPEANGMAGFSFGRRAIQPMPTPTESEAMETTPPPAFLTPHKPFSFAERKVRPMQPPPTIPVASQPAKEPIKVLPDRNVPLTGGGDMTLPFSFAARIVKSPHGVPDAQMEANPSVTTSFSFARRNVIKPGHLATETRVGAAENVKKRKVSDIIGNSSPVPAVGSAKQMSR